MTRIREQSAPADLGGCETGIDLPVVLAADVLSGAWFELACSMGYDLRRGGLTVPATDLIIAASALRAGAEVAHLDEHFAQIASVSSLGQRDLRP